MSKQREALGLALEALGYAHDYSLDGSHYECRQILTAQMQAIQEALAEPEFEPLTDEEIDSDTKRMVLELCRMLIERAGSDSMITRHMTQAFQTIIVRLEAGEVELTMFLKTI